MQRIGSYLGFLLPFYMVRRYGATISGLPAYLMPPVSGTIGALFLGEVITHSLIAGAILIFIGLFPASQ
jgi:drug/metabolite transporter (DMT)-like permease